MDHYLLKSLLGRCLKVIEVGARVILPPAELFDFIPHLVVVVTSDPLAHKELIREVAEVHGPMVPQEEVGELKRVLHFNGIRGENVLLEFHFHQ